MTKAKYTGAKRSHVTAADAQPASGRQPLLPSPQAAVLVHVLGKAFGKPFTKLTFIPRALLAMQ